MKFSSGVLIALFWFGVAARSAAVDLTELIQAMFDRGVRELTLPAGEYWIGTLDVPASTRISFAPGAVWKVSPGSIREKSLIRVLGDHVVLEGIRFDFGTGEGGEVRGDLLSAVVSANNVAHLRLRDLTIECESPWQSPEGRQTGFTGLNAVGCRDIEVSGCRTKNLVALVHTNDSAGVRVHQNVAVGGRYMTSFKHGSEFLNHTENWSHGITDQVCWWGGDANDGKRGVTEGTARSVVRGSRPGETGYDRNMAGAFDILISNNYAEHGRTLAWGAKGRQVIISGNLARFMSDMAYDVEGTAQAIISNNISINSKASGIGCYFWSESVLIANNIIIVDPKEVPEFAGDFVRLHSQAHRSSAESGAGEVLITGNLFRAEVSDRRRSIAMETTRGVTISNNRFINGVIESRKRPIESLTIRENEFTETLPGAGTVIRLTGAVRDFALVQNSFRRKMGELSGKEPFAVELEASELGLKRVERNTIEGWHSAISAVAVSPNANPRLLIRDNIVSGTLFVSDNRSDTFVVEGNRDAKTLRPIVPNKTAVGSEPAESSP